MDPASGDFLEGLVAKYPEEWLVVYCDDEVVEAQDKKIVLCLGHQPQQEPLLQLGHSVTWRGG